MLAFVASILIGLVKVELRIVKSRAPALTIPPIPLIPSSVKPLSPGPKLTFIVGLLPGAARTVMALPVPFHVP